MFICYNIMSYGAKWGQANYSIESFNPTQLDCNQWADAAVSAGMSYGLLTTKHHEGFCLWDSKTTEYDVAGTPYKKDIVKQFAEAFRKKGLGVGLYYSIWDSTHGVAKGQIDETKIAFIKEQLTELLTQYGKVDFLFFDGWYWHNGHREVNFSEIREFIRTLQPDCLVADNTHLQGYFHNDYVMFEGPFGAYPPEDNTMASAICDKIVGGNGWFWSEKSPDARCIKPQEVGKKISDLESRYCSFMLATLPNPQGLLDENQLTCLKEIGEAWTPNTNRKPLPRQPKWTIYSLDPVSVETTSGDGNHAVDGIMYKREYTHWTPDEAFPQSITLDLGARYSGLEVLTCVPLHKMNPERSLKEGNVTKYALYLSYDNKRFKKVAQGNWKADAKTHSVTFPTTTARYVKFEILEANGAASIAELAVGAFSAKPKRVADKQTE